MFLKISDLGGGIRRKKIRKTLVGEFPNDAYGHHLCMPFDICGSGAEPDGAFDLRDFPRNLGFGGADPDREIVQALSILTSDGGFSPANLAG